jgi:Ca2+-binding RTX toxin-like protein
MPDIKLDYALMAGAAYFSTRGDVNRIPAPAGWIPLDPTAGLDHRQIDLSGFEAAAFTNGSNEIVISFAGNYPGQPQDFNAAAALAAGYLDLQIIQSAMYYEDIKKAFPNANITFTGHSLGGGLAALMGVFFNKQAVTFDPAPFRNAATQVNAVALMALLFGTGYGLDTDLATFYALPFFLRGESKVSAISVDGEFLTNGPSNALRIKNGPVNVITNGSSSAGGVNGFGMNVLHMQQLLIALKQSENFRQATFMLPFLIPDLFDATLLFQETNSTVRDLLSHLVRREFGVPGIVGSDVDLLTKFGNDMVKIGIYGSADVTLKQALEKIAFQKYYDAVSGSFDEFFNKMTGGVRFDMTNMQGSIKGYDDLKAWLAANAPAEANGEISAFLNVTRRIALALDRNISADSSGDNISDFMFSGARGGKLIGGGGDDLLVGRGGMDTVFGGEGTDTLFGGADNDTLTGGKGNDVLDGGTGNDTYFWNTGDGNDTIVDSDKRGRVILDNGTPLEFAASNFTEVSATVYKSSDGKITLTHNSPWMLITEDGGQIVLGADFVDGNFGIHLRDALVDPIVVNAAVLNGTGDADLLNGSDVSDQLLGGDGDDGMRGEAGNDILDGGAGNDFGRGDDGDDVILGGAGDDLFGGNAGKDLLQGGAGADNLYGGDGDDQVYADAKVKLADAIAGTAAPTGIKGGFLSGGAGDDWIVGNADNELLEGGGGADIIVGGAGDDFILGDADLELWDTGTWEVSTDAAGNKTLLNISRYAGTLVPADGGNDEIYAGSGNDWVRGQAGDDILYREGGDDDLGGSEGADTLIGGDGNDKLFGDGAEVDPAQQGGDFLDGGSGNDILVGLGGADQVFGGTGDDQLLGKGDLVPAAYLGNDLLDCGDGNDILSGFGGDDTLIGKDCRGLSAEWWSVRNWSNGRQTSFTRCSISTGRP